MVTPRVLVWLVSVTGCAAEEYGAQSEPAPVPTSSADQAVLLSWSFEPASRDCNGWLVVGGDAIRAAPARSGTYSCKVCSNASEAELGLVRDVGAVPAGRYVLTAWIRKRVQTAAPSAALVRLDAEVSGVLLRAIASSTAPREAWGRLEATLDLRDRASNLRVTIGAPSRDDRRCLLVDDVTLVRR